MLQLHHGISRKLIGLALFHAVMLALLAAIIGVAFDHIERLSSKIAGDEMASVIENASISRQLSAAFWEIDLLSHHCLGDASFEKVSTRLSASITGIAQKVPDQELENAITVFSSAAAQLLEECALIDQALASIQRIDRQTLAELARLENIIGQSLIDDTLAGKSTNHLDQLISLTAGFRETLLLMGKQTAEQSTNPIVNKPSRHSIVALIDDLALRLQTLSASPPDIAQTGARISRLIAAYRREAITLNHAIDRFSNAFKKNHAAQKRVLANMQRLDGIAAGRAKGVSAEIGRIVKASRQQVLGLSALVALLSLVTAVWIIRRNINRPLKGVLQYIETIRSGAITPAAGSPRSDEWGVIQSALSEMSADLARSNAELRASQERLELALQGANDGLWDWNLETDEVYFSPRWKSMLGYADHELHNVLNTWRALVDPAQQQPALQHARDYLEGRALSFEIEFRMRHKAGHWVYILSRAIFARDAKGQPLTPRRLVGTHVDISERKRTETQLRQAASVFTHAREGIMITAADGAILDANDAFTRITGYNRDSALGRNPHFLSSGYQDQKFYAAMWRDLIDKGHWHGEVWNRRKNGELYAALQTISAVRDAQGNTQQYVALFSDITALKKHKEQLEYIAYYDALTALPNRLLLADRMNQAMAQARRYGQRLAVGYLDLDGFKEINDNHGHEAGDQLLARVATLMRQALREGDTLARLGGDEFVAVLLDMADIEVCQPVLARLLTAAAQPIPIKDHTLQVSASLGVTFYPQAEEVDTDQLLRQADQAMYQAKMAGKNRHHIFDAEQDCSVRGRHESLERISSALSAGEFVLYYQPKANMRTGAVIGAEALIRWQHPESGLLPPAHFLPVIENHPLSIELGEWVIDSALTQMALWQAAGLRIGVSVNIGARQLQQAGFVERLRALLAAHPEVRPNDLELEVLETSALEDLTQVAQIIKTCQEIGVIVALDDFGAGYSSLTYLKRLPVTHIKINQRLIGGILDNADDPVLLEGILSLATAFRLQVIAEGVETVEHGAMLLQLGCESAQGYGIAHPMPADELPGWAAAWRPHSAWIDLPSASHNDLPLLFARVEHRAWITALEHYLKGQREKAPTLDLDRCRFSAWLDTEKRTRHGAWPAFQTVDSLHQQIHALAVDLCELQATDGKAETIKKLSELHALQDALLDQLKALAQENRQSFNL